MRYRIGSLWLAEIAPSEMEANSRGARHRRQMLGTLIR